MSASTVVGGSCRCQRNAANRSGRGSRPTASQSPATDRHSRSSSGRSAMAVVRTTRVAPAANASRIPSAVSTPPATWSGTPTRAATAADRLEVDRRPRAGPIEIDEVDGLGAHRDEPFGDPFRSVGRGADPGGGSGPEHGPRTTGLQVDGGDDLHRQASRDATAWSSPSSSRRWKLIGSDPAVSRVSWNALRSKASPRRTCSSARRPRSIVRPSR